MLNEVCRASGWPSLTPGRPLSQARLALGCQLIAEFPDIAGPHQEHQVTLTYELFQVLSSTAQVGREACPRHPHGQVNCAEAARVLLAGRIDLRDHDGVG